LKTSKITGSSNFNLLSDLNVNKLLPENSIDSLSLLI
jgi:hypothetical protein